MDIFDKLKILADSAKYVQLSMFDTLLPTKEDKIKCLTGSL